MPDTDIFIITFDAKLKDDSGKAKILCKGH